MGTARDFFRTRGVWFGLSLLVAMGVGLLIGAWGVWLGYAVFNGVGVVLYTDALDPRRPASRRRRRVLRVLAVALLPVGVFGLFASPSSADPREAAIGDESVRSEAARAEGGMHGIQTGKGP